MAAIGSPHGTTQSAGDTPAGSQHGPKLRSRKHGAAIELDDLDKRLLNLMQGSFPISRQPYQHVASAAGITEQEVMDRVQRLQIGRAACRGRGEVFVVAVS